MQSTMRWYGPSDPVKLEYIRQVPCVNGIVAAMFEIPVGEVWSENAIVERKKHIASHGLEMVVLESIPIHESIKLGTPDREQYIHNYQQSIRNMAAEEGDRRFYRTRMDAARPAMAGLVPRVELAQGAGRVPARLDPRACIGTILMMLERLSAMGPLGTGDAESPDFESLKDAAAHALATTLGARD